jgi:selenocysteine-specific elongation factor
MDADLQMMICTAGHVDHGKTRLVKLLTGCSTDRLKEEQERGLTIELGFAPCLLAGEVCVGIVDVPGHEKFVRNMVAGVSGIDMAVLVVAADDGVMPQTVEHLQIMELVGVRHGMVALTKTDMVAAQRIEEVKRQVRELLAGTFMEGARIFPVSSETLDGLSDFYKGLVEEARGMSRRRSAHVFRMPILNAFSSEGFGSVVTGIPVDGTIAIGQRVELVPGGQVGSVRGIQRFLRDASEGGFGQCLAVNVPDFGKLEPRRGQVLCVPGYVVAARSFELRITAVAGIGRPLRNAEEVVFHTGTSEERGKLYLLEEKTLGPGAVGLASIVLSNPVPAVAHDRYIIRRASPAMTVAGGEIIAAEPGPNRPRRKHALAKGRLFLDTFAGVDPSSPEGLRTEVEYSLRTGGIAEHSLERIAKRTLLTKEVAAECLAHLVEEGKALKLAADNYVHVEAYRACLAEVVARVEEIAAAGELLEVGINDLRRGIDWPLPLWNRLQADLEREQIVTRRGDRLVLREAVRELDDGLDDDERSLMARLLAVYEETGFRSPRPDELPDLLQAPPERTERLLDFSCAREELFRLTPNVVLSRSWLSKAQGIVVDLIQRDGELDSAEFKGHLDSTRKYALAVLDYLDARKVTVRRGNQRRLAEGYTDKLI